MFKKSKASISRWRKKTLQKYTYIFSQNKDNNNSNDNSNKSTESSNLNNIEQHESISFNNLNNNSNNISNDELGLLINDFDQNSENDFQLINQMDIFNQNLEDDLIDQNLENNLIDRNLEPDFVVQNLEDSFQSIDQNNDNLNNNLNQDNIKTSSDIILDKIFLLYNKFKLNNVVVNEFLRIIKYISSNKDKNFDDLPGSFYSLKKHYISNIEVQYGFKTSCCNQYILVKKDDKNEFYCGNCKISMKSNKIFHEQDYFFHLDLRTIITLLIHAFKLIPVKFSENNKIETYYDSQVYKELEKLRPNGKLLLLTLFIDGVEISSTSIIKDKKSDNTPKNEVWPVFFKCLNLNTSDNNKTFLSSSILSQESYPSANIYLQNIVQQLNDLFLNGIQFEDQVIYPVLFNLIADSPARNLVMNNVSHNGFYGCSFCLVKGININHVQVFELVEEVLLLKSNQVYDDALIKLNEGFDSFLGNENKFFLSNLFLNFIFYLYEILFAHFQFLQV